MLSAGRERVPHTIVLEHLWLEGGVVPPLDVQVVPRVLPRHSHVSHASVVQRAYICKQSQQSYKQTIKRTPSTDSAYPALRTAVASALFWCSGAAAGQRATSRACRPPRAAVCSGSVCQPRPSIRGGAGPGTR